MCIYTIVLESSLSQHLCIDDDVKYWILGVPLNDSPLIDKDSKNYNLHCLNQMMVSKNSKYIT